jgi:hypothetical protein
LPACRPIHFNFFQLFQDRNNDSIFASGRKFWEDSQQPSFSCRSDDQAGWRVGTAKKIDGSSRQTVKV